MKGTEIRNDSQLVKLPNEILAVIAADLNFQTLIRLLTTNKYFYHQLTGNKQFFGVWSGLIKDNQSTLWTLGVTKDNQLIQNVKIKAIIEKIDSILKSNNLTIGQLPSMSFYLSLLRNSQHTQEVEKSVEKNEISLNRLACVSKSALGITYPISLLLIIGPAILLGNIYGPMAAIYYVFGSMMPVAGLTVGGHMAIVHCSKKCVEQRQEQNATKIAALEGEIDKRIKERNQKTEVKIEESALLSYQHTDSLNDNRNAFFENNNKQQTRDAMILELPDVAEHIDGDDSIVVIEMAESNEKTPLLSSAHSFAKK